MNNELRNAVCFIKDRLYLLSSKNIPLKDTQQEHFFTVDEKFIYEPFYNDFGPVHLGHTITFCRIIEQKMKNPSLSDKRIVVLTGLDGHKRANASYLISAYMVIVQGQTPEDAYKPFANVYPPFIPFRDASQSISTYNLTILDCLRGIAKAIAHRFLVYETFNAEEYYHYEKVENGDLNWIVPSKFLAFSSPASRRITPDGMIHLTPDDYYPMFKKWNVTAVVRLNKKLYDRKQFTNYNINHYDMYYIDGGLPPEPILTKFLEIAQSEKGGIAVHCKAGLGRTGTLIGMYLMKHHHFSAADVIAWLRIVRPGSVIGIQQHYLKDMQPRMFKVGESIFGAMIANNTMLSKALDRLENSARQLVSTPTSPVTPNGSTFSNQQLFSSRTSSNGTIPSPINTTKTTPTFAMPSSPQRGSSVLGKPSTSTLGSDSPSRAMSSSSVHTRPQKSNRPMTTTGLSRAIPVLTQTLQSTHISNELNEEYNHGRSSYARDTGSINVHHPGMANVIMSNSTSLTPTSLRTSNMITHGPPTSSISTGTLFGPKSSTHVSTSNPIKKMHHLAEMNNKYVPNRQAKKNFLLQDDDPYSNTRYK